ncbi:MAG: translocation/assembly module TamB domain-containing protein [Planctomycetes bacterium]|nr:translocation/assembly module TamB domain-containing protein [Planctomycetota bacterium]
MSRRQPDIGQGRGRRGRWRRRWVAALLSLLLVPLLLVLFRNTLVRRALPRVTPALLGMELHAESVAISLAGRVTVTGVMRGSAPAQGPVRDIAFRKLDIRTSWLKLILGDLEGVEAISLEGLVLEVDLLHGPPSAGPEEETAPFTWPQGLPEIHTTVERLLVRRGDDWLQIDGLALDVTSDPAQGSVVSLDAGVAWTLGERTGEETLALECTYAAGSLRDLRFALGHSGVAGRGEVDLQRLDGKAAFELDGLTIQLDFSPSRVAGQGEIGDLNDLARWLPEGVPQLGGMLNFSFATLGPLTEPTIEVGLQGRDLTLAEFPLGTLEGDVEVNSETLRVVGLRLHSEIPAPFDLAVQGAIRWEDGYLEALTLSGKAEDLVGLVRGLQPDLAAHLPPGEAQFQATVRGDCRWPDVDLTVRSGRVDGEPSRTVTWLELKKAADHLSLSIDAFPLAEGHLSLRLAGELSESLTSGAFSLGRLVYALPDVTWRSVGESRLAFDLEKSHFTIEPPITLSDGRGELHLGLLPTTEGEVPGHLADLRLRYPGAFPLGPPLLPFSMRDVDFLCKGRCRLLAQTETGPFLPETLELQLSSGAIELAYPASGKLKSMDLRAQVWLSSGDPQVDLALRVPEFEFHDPNSEHVSSAPVLGSLAIDLQYREGLLTLERADCRLEAVDLSVSGRAVLKPPLVDLFAHLQVPLFDELDVTVAGDVNDLAQLAQFTSQQYRLSGEATLEGHLTGSSQDPRFTATLHLQDVTARFEGLPPLLELNADLALDGDRVTVDSFVTELGGAPMEVSGEILSLVQEPRFDLAITGKDLLLARTDNLKIRSDVEIAVRGPLSALEVTGALRITEGRMRQQMGSMTLGALLSRAQGALGEPHEKDLTQRSAALQLFSLRDAPLKDMTLNVAITSQKAIDLEGEAFQGRLRPDLRLLGPGETPYLVGSLYLDEFVFKLPVADIKTESSVITFHEKRPLYPELTLLGVCRVRGYDVTVSVTGPYNEPVVTLSSSPPLPADQLLLLVTTGKMPDSVDPEAQQKAAFAVAQYFALHLLQRLFGEEDIDDTSTSILDRFEYESGQNVSYSGADTWEARFRVKRELFSERDDLYLVGQRDEFDGYSIGVRLVVHD